MTPSALSVLDFRVRASDGETPDDADEDAA
jgi:hypothetical protein